MITKKDIYGWNTSYRPNTFIGGVGTTISTKSLLAAKLGISTTRIKSFRIVNDEVQACIENTYNLPQDCFKNDTNILWYKDNDRLVKAMSIGSFVGCTNLELLELYGLTQFSNTNGQKIAGTRLINLYFPEMTSINGNNSIQNNAFLETFDAPIATSIPSNSTLSSNPNLRYINIPNVIGYIGSTTGNNNTFNGCKDGCVINVHISMMTNTNGLPDADLSANLNLDVNYINYEHNSENYNTEIGGISLTHSSRYLIGKTLGIGSARVVDFSLVGQNIRFRAIGQYTIGTDAFRNNLSITFFKTTIPTNFGKNCFMDSSVTSLISPLLTDIIDAALYNTKCITYEFPLCSVINNSGFTHCTEMEHLNLPELLSIKMWQTFDGATKLKTFKADKLHTMTDGASRQFDGTINFELFDAKKLKTLPSTFAPTGSNVFKGWKIGAKMMVNAYLATSNSGSPSPHIQWVKDSRNAIVEFYDDDGNYVSTL